MSVVLYKGNTSPSVTDTITVAGVAVNLTGATVRFRARDPRTSALVIDALATITNPTGGAVRYDPSSTDTAVAYASPPLTGWWNVTLASAKVQDAPEFPVYILDHAQATTSDLCTLTDIRTHLGIQPSDTSKDQRIQELIVEASQAIIHECEREFAPVTTGLTRRFKVDRSPGAVIELAPYDLRSVTSVSLNPETSSPTALQATIDYMLEPLQSFTGTYRRIRFAPANPIFSTVSVKYGYALVDITGTWGFASVPSDVKDACILTVASRIDRATAAYGSQDSLLGDPLSVQPGAESSYDIPVGAWRKLRRYKSMVP